MNYAQEVAKALLAINAVGFKPYDPLTFKSGIKSPVYIDNRRFPFWPKQWRIVLTGFKQLIADKNIEFDIVAGIESAGIPHSAALGLLLNKPSVFTRKQLKHHGTKKGVEGGDVIGERVLLIEDHITTGGSSLSGVITLRNSGAIVNYCLAITSYEFKEVDQAFKKEKVRYFTLTSFSVILKEALKQKKFSHNEKKIIEDWLKDPHGWGKRHGFE